MIDFFFLLISQDSFLAASFNGSVTEVTLLEDIPDPPTNSFEILLPLRTSRFKSVKSEIVQNMSLERNMRRNEKRKLCQMTKEIYPHELFEYMKRKLDKLDEKVSELAKHEDKENKQFLKIAMEKVNQKKLASLLRQFHLYKLSLTSDKKDDTESKNITSSNSEMSCDSISILQEIADERKKVNDITDVFDREPHEELKEVAEKILEIKDMYTKQKGKHSKYIECGNSDMEQEEIDEEKRFVDETVSVIDKFIISELMKISDYENVG